MDPKLSILISARDQIKLTKKCIECLEQTLGNTISHEVLIVNDGVIDGTAKYLDSLSSFYWVSQASSQGFAKNNNWIAREARGNIFYFLITMPLSEGIGSTHAQCAQREIKGWVCW